VLTVGDWAEIRRLHLVEQMPIKVIARTMGCSKNTVQAALCSEGPPKYERVARGSLVDEVKPRIRELLQAWPTMPATVVAERIGRSISPPSSSTSGVEAPFCPTAHLPRMYARSLKEGQGDYPWTPHH